MHLRKISSILSFVIIALALLYFAYTPSKDKEALPSGSSTADSNQEGVKPDQVHTDAEVQSDIKDFYKKSLQQHWTHLQTEVLMQKSFADRVSRLIKKAKELEELIAKWPVDDAELKNDMDLLVQSLQTLPGNARQSSCDDYLRKFFTLYEPDSFRADLFNKSWTALKPLQEPLQKSYPLLVLICQSKK